MTLRILTLNIANPSAARAERQVAWLAERSEHVLVLTETSPGVGTRLLLERLSASGWDVRRGALAARERGVAIATRVRAEARGGDIVDHLPGRAELVALDRLHVIGLYVPSRDDSQEKTERKRRFCGAVSRFLAERPTDDAVVIGDLNVLEPIHRPHYWTFRDWEYRFYDEFVVRGLVDAYRERHPNEMEYSWVDYETRRRLRSPVRHHWRHRLRGPQPQSPRAARPDPRGRNPRLLAGVADCERRGRRRQQAGPQDPDRSALEREGDARDARPSKPADRTPEARRVHRLLGQDHHEPCGPP
jgi:exodeoxyribonuclease-3